MINDHNVISKSLSVRWM